MVIWREIYQVSAQQNPLSVLKQADMLNINFRRQVKALSYTKRTVPGPTPRTTAVDRSFRKVRPEFIEDSENFRQPGYLQLNS